MTYGLIADFLKTVFIILLTFPLHAFQSTEELKMVLEREDEDICEKARAANILTTRFGDSNEDSTDVYLHLSRGFADDCPDKTQYCRYLINYGARHSTQWELDQTISFYDSLLNLSPVLDSDQLRAIIYTNLAREYGVLGLHEEAVQNNLMGLQLYEKIEDRMGVATTSYNLGVIYYNQNQYELALDKFIKGRKEFKILGNRDREAYCLNGVAAVYQNLDSLDKSLEYTKELSLLADEINNAVMKGAALTSLGAIYGEQKSYELARQSYIEAIPFIRQYGNNVMVATCYCNLAGAESFLKEFEVAKRHLDTAYAQLNAEESLVVKDICLFIKGVVYEEMGLYEEAASAYAEYIEFQDSVLLKENKLVIAELEEKYENQKKEAEIAEQKIEIRSKTYTRNMLVGGLSLSLLLGSTFIWNLVVRNKKNRKIASQQQALSSQMIASLEQEKRLLSLSSVLEGQENERIRIAKDLHDGLGGLLTSAKIHLDKVQEHLNEVKNLDIYSKASSIIDKAHDEVRRISHNLMPGDLRAGGLPVAIRQLVHELKTIHSVDADLEMVGFNEERLPQQVEFSTYRIIQELINNIVKYADANHVFVQLSRFENEMQVVVEDDGVGFDMDKALEKSGLGIRSIIMRVEQMKGSIDIDSTPGKGTSVTINIPL